MSIFRVDNGVLGQPKVQEAYNIIIFWFLMEKTSWKYLIPWMLKTPLTSQFSNFLLGATYLICALWFDEKLPMRTIWRENIQMNWKGNQGNGNIIRYPCTLWFDKKNHKLLFTNLTRKKSDGLNRKLRKRK